MKIPDFLKHPVILFLLKALALYVIWYIAYEVWLHPTEIIDSWVIKVTLQASLALLHLMGYHTFSPYFKEIGIDGTNGLFMGDNCNSIDLFALFTGFIIAFPGVWKKKLWYIPLGIITIFLCNVIRVTLLAIIQKNYSTKALEFNHTYTFTVLVYLVIFMLWVYWIRKGTSPAASRSGEAA